MGRVLWFLHDGNSYAAELELEHWNWNDCPSVNVWTAAVRNNKVVAVVPVPYWCYHQFNPGQVGPRPKQQSSVGDTRTTV